MLNERNQIQKSTTPWLHFNDVQEQPKSIYGDRSQNGSYRWDYCEGGAQGNVPYPDLGAGSIGVHKC